MPISKVWPQQKCHVAHTLVASASEFDEIGRLSIRMLTPRRTS